MHPLLSIIIPTYNSALLLEECLQSVLNQTFKNFEVLVVDGLSKDNTLQVLEEVSNGDQRVRCISEQDNGIYDAMNKGLKLANGKWVYFLGSDDRLYSNTILEEVFNTEGINQHDVIYGNVLINGNTTWAKDKEVYDGLFDLQKLLVKNICHQCIFYKRNLIETVGFYNTDYRSWADWDYNLRCWAKSKFYYFETIVAVFNAGGDTTSGKPDSKFLDDYIDNVLKNFDIDIFNPLINNSSFPLYYKVLEVQKQKHFFKYSFVRFKNKLNRFINGN